MFHLPEEIIQYIYEFDNTYRQVFDRVLHSRYQIFQNKKTKSYFIFDQFSGKAFVTDSLENPTWKTTHHTHRRKNTKGDKNLLLENFKTKMIDMYELEKVDEILKYNIHEKIFYRP
jgi:hypothetical protein